MRRFVCGPGSNAHATVGERDYAIANFVTKPFYDVMAKAEAGFDAKWQVPESVGDDSGRCLSRDAASLVVSQCQGQMATVSVFETKRQKARHPALMFLGSLQKAMSAQYGYTAQQVLDTAQALYEKHKLTTYPRTDCAFLPFSQQGEVSQIFSALMKAGELTLNLPKVVEPQAPCPLCGKTMRLRQGKKAFWACEDREQCGLILDNQRHKSVKYHKCACGKGVLVRKSVKNNGSFYWSCSAWKQGCQKRHFDNKGQLGQEIDG